MEKKKAEFLEIYRKNMGILTTACRKADIASRQTIYNWMKSDPEFEQAMKAVLEERKDFAENAMLQKIQAGDTACILFYLKTQCRDRGYIERSELAVDSAVDEELKSLARKFFEEPKK